MAPVAPDVAESSRGGQEVESEAELEPQRKWVALVSAAVLLGDEDQRAQEIGGGTGVPFEFDLNEPPLPSYMVLHPLFAPDPRRNDGPMSAYIVATDSSAYLLVQVVEGNGNLPDFFLCNTHTGIVGTLPPVPAYIQDAGHGIRPRVSIGLIADPHHHDHYVVAQLHPATSVGQADKLLYFSTAEGRWFIRGLDLQPAPTMRKRLFSETGVLAHDGCLWWVALAYGVFFCCDPCPQYERPQLRFLPFPGDCEIEGDVFLDPRIRTLIEQRRCVRLSDGKLRFVEIRGLSYDERVDVPAAANPSVRMWTLSDPAGPSGDAWTLEYQVALPEIWDSKSYADAGLPPREVPHVALVDLYNHFVVYFFQGSKLFGFDMREKKVVACKDCLIDPDQVQCQSSRPIVDAWEHPPPPPEENVLDNIFAIAQSCMGLQCRRKAFCSICCSAICLSCCPNHKSCHHGNAPGVTLTVNMSKDGPAVDAKAIKRNGMGYNWNSIQRKMDAGRKLIILRNPPEDFRTKSQCLQCKKAVKSKSLYCSPACKVQHRPNGQSTDIINALVGADFNLAATIDQFCHTCMRGFASAHCMDHGMHQNAAEAPPAHM